jgi:hypothetical protein
VSVPDQGVLRLLSKVGDVIVTSIEADGAPARELEAFLESKGLSAVGARLLLARLVGEGRLRRAGKKYFTTQSQR